MLRVLIADDHALIREGIKLAVQKLAEEAEVIEAADGEQVRRIMADNVDLDLVLLDLFMPHAEGFTLLRDLCEQLPDTPVLVLSASEDAGNMRKAIDWGAAGYITKAAPEQELLNALRQVLAGGVYIPDMSGDDELTEGTAANDGNAGDKPEQRQPRLTNRQKHVLSLLCLGKTNKDIGRALKLSEYTVKVHITAIFKELKVRNRTEAVLEAKRLKLLPRSSD